MARYALMSGDPRSNLSTRNSVSCRLLSLLQLVVVTNICAKAECGCDLGVSRRQLVPVVRQEKVERVLRIQIDQHQVCVMHGEFAETKLRAVISHEISLNLRWGRRAAVLQYDLITANRNGTQLSVYMRRRKNLGGIQNQVVLLSPNAIYFSGVD